MESCKGDIYRYEMKVLESHLDSFGHVNNAKYLEMFEEARWDLITNNGYGLKKVMSERIGPVLLNAEIKYKRELHVREKIQVETVFVGMKNRLTIYVEQTMKNEQDEVASTLNVSLGIMDLNKRRLIKPPKDWLEAFGAPKTKNFALHR